MRADRRVLRQLAIALPAIRDGRDGDAAGIVALIERCWSDYPGCVLDIDAEAPELRALASYYAGCGGALWVADDVWGMIAVRPGVLGAWEICRVYVHPDRHGSGMGGALVGIAEAYALGRGATGFELWTDTRFERAHRFYEKLGYRRGVRRSLHDLSHSDEWHYSKGVAQAG